MIVEDDVKQQVYPQPVNAVNRPETFVGRIRQDLDVKNGFHLWIVSDNLWKGAAYNSIEIAETLIARDLI